MSYIFHPEKDNPQGPTQFLGREEHPEAKGCRFVQDDSSGDRGIEF